jgi:predicted AAA+ superfamily ATPase
MAASYRADPDAALRRAARPLLLDEWQEVPAVLAAVKRAVDADGAPGQFILTGSVRAELQNETWAGTGRTVRMGMYPLVERELQPSLEPGTGSFLERFAAGGIDAIGLPDEVPNIDSYIDRALRGGFPEIVYREYTVQQRGIWLQSYIEDLLTRDARVLDVAKDPAKLRRYLNALALNIAGMPTHATLYRAAGVNAKTAAGYDQLLRNLYVLDVVPPWTSSRIDRLIRAGKRYVIDTGLAAAAAGVTAQAVLRDAGLLGRYFDAFGTAQLRAEAQYMQPRPALFHMRTESGRQELDLVVELGAGQVLAFEFKAGVAPDASDARHLFGLRDRLGAEFAGGAVLHSGPSIYSLGDRVHAIPLCAVWA